MLRNAPLALSYPLSLTALCRSFSSSSSCHNPKPHKAAWQPAKPQRAPLRKGKMGPGTIRTRAVENTQRGMPGGKYKAAFEKSGGFKAKTRKSDSPRSWPPPTKGGRKAPRTEDSRHLRAPELAEMVKAAAHSGMIDDAVELVQNAPLDAQNVVVWNTLLTEVMVHRRYKLAYTLFVDMKRRAFVPNARTYGTLLQGYTQVEDWSEFTLQLDNVHKIYDGYVEHIETLRLQGGAPSELSSGPVTHYISILGKAGLWQRFFDVYNELSLDDPPFPNQFTYSAVLEALDARRHLPGFTDAQVHMQNASDAKLVWKQIVKASAKLGFVIDSHLIRVILRLLARGGPSDHLFAFDIVREHMGLAPPGQTAEKASVPLNSFTLEPLLQLCNKANKPSLCLHYLEQAIQKDPSCIINNHCDIALKANAMQAAKGSLSESSRAYNIVAFMLEQDALGSAEGKNRHIRPKIRTLRLALVPCWRGGDWEIAVQLFERLTQHELQIYADGQPSVPEGESLNAERTRGRWIDPDASVLSLLARTALASGDVANMRQCLRLIQYIGGAILAGEEGIHREGRTGEEVTHREARVGHEKDTPYFQAKYAQSIIDLVNAVNKAEAGEGDYTVSSKEKKEWESLKKMARRQLSQHPEWQNAATPEVEASRLGSARGMSAMEAHVDYQMTHRHLKSA